jgi:excisionase family DNA binding protein
MTPAEWYLLSKMAHMDGFDLTAKEIAQSIAGKWEEQYPPILTVDEAAALARVPKGTIYSWSSQGLLSGCSARAGKHLRIWRDNFIQSLFNGEFASGS